jgi:hypothetical protein
MKKYLKYVILSFAMLVVWHSTFAQKATNIEQII